MASKNTSKHVALLRGINVGRTTTLPMKELAEICTDLGWENVQTYLRTGNIVFDARQKAKQLEASLEKAIEKAFSFSIPVIVRSQSVFSSYLEGVPFPAEAENDPSHLILYLSKSPPATTTAESLRSKASAGESVIQASEAVWIYYPNGISRSRITPTAIDRSIGSPATGRNWNTLAKVAKLCEL